MLQFQNFWTKFFSADGKIEYSVLWVLKNPFKTLKLHRKINNDKLVSIYSNS